MIFTGSLIKAQNIPSKRKHLDTIIDEYRNMKGYNEHVRSFAQIPSVVSEEKN